MKDELSRYTLRVEQKLLDKLGYIAEYEGRTKNRELEQMIKKRIRDSSRSTERSRWNNRKAKGMIPSLLPYLPYLVPKIRSPASPRPGTM